MKLREVGKESFISYDLVTRWEESEVKGIEWSKCPVCKKIGSPPKDSCDCGFILSPNISLKMFGKQ